MVLRGPQFKLERKLDEQFDVFLTGAYLSLLLHHEGDQAIMGSGSIKILPGITTGISAAKPILLVSPGTDD